MAVIHEKRDYIGIVPIRAHRRTCGPVEEITLYTTRVGQSERIIVEGEQVTRIFSGISGSSIDTFAGDAINETSQLTWERRGRGFGHRIVERWRWQPDSSGVNAVAAVESDVLIPGVYAHHQRTNLE